MSQTTPNSAPADALSEHWEWLEHQGSGSPSVRQHALEMLEDVASAEARVRQDYVGRYPLELLQNAHDAASDAGQVGRVQFVVTPTALLVANEGVPFTYERVKSLLRLGASEKAPRRGRGRLIGYKGVGFNAVFEVCDRPQVISETVAFGFDPEMAKARIIEHLGRAPKRLPTRPFAHEIAASDWAPDRQRIAELQAAGAVTVIRLPLRQDRSSADIEEDLRLSITPEALLFMPAVREIRMSGPSLRFWWSRHRGRRTGKGRVINLRSKAGQQRPWLVHENTIAADKNAILDLRDELWADVRRLSVAVALPWKRKVDPDVGSQALRVYFPTDDDLGRSVLVHGDFYVQSNRRRIEANGPGGVITRQVAREAARLTAELSASISHQGNPLLRTLAPRYEPDGFGHALGEMIDEELGRVRLLRAANGTRKTPDEISRLGSGLRIADEVALMELSGHPSDLLFPGDDVGEAAELLDALGVDVLDADDLAPLLDGSRTSLSYGRVASLLVRWLDSLVGIYETRTAAALKARPILQDVRGRWAPPDELVVRMEAAAQLPMGLERREVARPPGRYGKKLVERMGVPEFNVDNAVEATIDAVQAGRLGTSGAAAQGVLRFLLSIWKKEPERLRAHRDRLGVIRVPAKTVGRGKATWRQANETYFSSAWTGETILETLYGGGGVAEFLAARAPSDQRKRESDRSFFEALGVAATMRTEQKDTTTWRRGRWTPFEDGDSWQELPEFADIGCPSGHPESLRLRVWVVDRLDEVLADVTIRQAKALATGLARLEQPYGKRAEVHCVNSSHSIRLLKRVMGYQRWLLENTEWVPVTRDPARDKLREPRDVWVDISPRESWLTLPRTTLPKEVSRAFDFTSPQRPRAEPLERALDHLADTFDDPNDAPDDVLRTARWLQERLDAALRRGTKSFEVPRFLCRKGGEWAWDFNPVIADLPGVDSFDLLPLLPLGSWRGVRKVYELRKASEVVQVRVRAGEKVRGSDLLSLAFRSKLLAVLVKSGVDTRNVARRLAQISLRPVASLRIEFSSNGTGSSVDRPFYMEVVRTARGRVSEALLYYVPGRAINFPALGRELATLLDEESHAQAIAVVLFDAAQALADEAVTDDDVDEARRLLEAARRRARISDEDEEGEDSDLEHGMNKPASSAMGAPDSGQESDQVSTDGPAQGRQGVGYDPGSQGDGVTPPRRAAEATSRDIAFGAEQRTSMLVAADVGFAAAKPGERRERPARRRRPVRTTGSGSGGYIRADAETEERAVAIVKRYGREVLGATVDDVQDQHRGWDLEFILPNGRRQFVEVKGTRGDASFAITRNERRAASEADYRSGYVLYWVANAGSPADAELRIFDSIGSSLTENEVEAIQWEVFDWSALPHRVVRLQDIGAAT